MKTPRTSPTPRCSLVFMTTLTEGFVRQLWPRLSAGLAQRWMHTTPDEHNDCAGTVSQMGKHHRRREAEACGSLGHLHRRRDGGAESARRRVWRSAACRHYPKKQRLARESSPRRYSSERTGI